MQTNKNCNNVVIFKKNRRIRVHMKRVVFMYVIIAVFFAFGFSTIIASSHCQDQEIQNTTSAANNTNNTEDSSAFELKITDACENLKARKAVLHCKSLYAKSQPCYGKKGELKNKCLKTIAGFAKAQLKFEDPETRDELSRNYAILLLNDLQEKVNDAVTNQKLNADKGSEINAKVLEIKEALLMGKSKNEIRPLFNQLETMLKNTHGAIK